MDQDSRTQRIVSDLLDVCEDGEQGFRRCAERIDRPELRQLFEQRAQECRRAADELARLVGERAAEPESGGSVSGAVHRGWVRGRASQSRPGPGAAGPRPCRGIRPEGT
jgi:uncharacterized protein (TIGR02284 family)